MDDKLRDLTVSLERCFLKLTNTYERQPKETNNKRLKHLGRMYGIKIITEDSIHSTDIKYDAPTRSQISTAAKAIEKHLSVYPVEVIQKSRIEQITLTRNLKINNYNRIDTYVAGLAKSGYDVVDTLFIDAKSISNDDWHGNRLFHHELFHAIDFRDTWFGHIDRDWKNLQDPNFKYGIEQLREHLKTMGPVLRSNIQINEFEITGVDAKPSKEPGFVSDYARMSYVEDKAEIYASMITDYESLMERTKEDPPLKRKVEHMKMLLAKFCSCYNDEFWDNLANQTWSNS